MGKRRKEKTDDQIKHKIRRLQRELQERQISPAITPARDNKNEDLDHESNYEYENINPNENAGVTSISSREEDPEPDYLESETMSMYTQMAPMAGEPNTNQLESVVVEVTNQTEENTVPAEILAVLGEAKNPEEKFGNKIPVEISERWGKIIVEGLVKEQKETLLAKTLIPENFQLAKAPKLNAEVASVLNDSTKNRDKRLEKLQDQLGAGIARLANFTSELISKDICKMDIIRNISEVNQILLDLHYEQTMNRRRLLLPILDKSFINIIQGVKRDKFLFGDNLGENIKTNKSIEKSSQQIKKAIYQQPSSSRKPPAQQGNSRAPPRQASGPGPVRMPPANARYYQPPPPPAARRPPPPPPPPPPGPRRAPQPHASARPQDRRHRR